MIALKGVVKIKLFNHRETHQLQQLLPLVGIKAWCQQIPDAMHGYKWKRND